MFLLHRSLLFGLKLKLLLGGHALSDRIDVRKCALRYFEVLSLVEVIQVGSQIWSVR